jgi:protoporphyrinogen oxidase
MVSSFLRAHFCWLKAADIQNQINDLDILDSVRWVKKTDPGAQNRYIYDGGDELSRVPTNLGALLGDFIVDKSVMRPAIKHAIFNAFRKIDALPATTNSNLGQAMSQIVGEQTVQTLLSSFIHGIYAGNVWNLSTRARGPWSKVLKEVEHESKTLLEIMRSEPDLSNEPFWVGPHPDWWKEYQESFVFYLKEGLGLLPLAIESHLRMNTKFDISLKSEISGISMNEDSTISVSLISISCYMKV